MKKQVRILKHLKNALSELRQECQDLLHWFYVKNFLYQKLLKDKESLWVLLQPKDSDVSVI
jgi:hypothetical protein